MISDRELRLRQRIDELRDQRDQARAQAQRATEKLAVVRRRRDRLADRVYLLERSLALWRQRARR
jgi:uncharacterized coiled-coil DUF342 family protein